MKIIFSIITLVILFIFLGFVSYEGFTSKPKSYATKTIYAVIVKYTKDEIKKCNSVGSTYMDILKCPAEPKKTIEKLLDIYSKSYNPLTFNENKLPGGSLYKEGVLPAEPIFKKNINITDDANAGFININFSNHNITFELCFAKPCKSEENRLKDTIIFQ